MPTLHAKVVPAVRSALSGSGTSRAIGTNDWSFSAGTVPPELLYALALGATCLAYGVDLNLAQLVFVNTAASVLSFLVPTPVASGPLRRASRPASSRWGRQADRLAIAITQRLWTFDLPPIWGYVSLRWLSRRGYI